MKELICKFCGKTFLSKNRNAQFCSNTCHGLWRTANKPVYTRTCECCGKTFIINSPTHKKRYCSSQCARAWQITKVLKVCEQCGQEFTVIKSREKTALYCCKICADKAKKKEPNIYCSVCGKPIKRKLSHVLKNKHGNFCSKKCANQWKATAYLGEGNHQFGLKGPLNASFKGLIIDKKNHNLTEKTIWVPNHPFANKNQRVLYHRYLVEQNYFKFDNSYFINIENNFYLKPGIQVHHINGCHDDNSLDNLIPCTEEEHQLFHALMKVNPSKIKDILKIVTAVFKQGELLENPEVDNQQPSFGSNTIEGSTTNSRILSENSEDSNADTSALPDNVGDDIV